MCQTLSKEPRTRINVTRGKKAPTPHQTREYECALAFLSGCRCSLGCAFMLPEGLSRGFQPKVLQLHCCCGADGQPGLAEGRASQATRAPQRSRLGLCPGGPVCFCFHIQRGAFGPSSAHVRACEFAGPLALLNVVVRCQRLLFSKFMKHIVKGIKLECVRTP